MSDLRVAFGNEKIGRTYSRSVQRERDRVLASMRGTAEAQKDEIISRGRANIKAASRAFAKSKRWASGLNAKITEGGGTIKTTVTHTEKTQFFVHEKGATIRAKNKSGLLWIPLSFAKDAKGIMARDFPDPLFRVDRDGKAPLLLSAADKKPKYFGVPSVKIPKRFRIFEIIREITRKVAGVYKKQFRLNKDI